MNENFLLSLCIPTFNRVDKVLYLLELVRQQIVGLETEIEVIVSDNHTEHAALQKLIDYSQMYPFFTLYLQKENLELIGNSCFLIEKAVGKYIWIFGDDDILLDGALIHIIGLLQHNIEKIGCFHLNYNHYTNSVENIIPSNYSYGNNVGFINDVDSFLCEYSRKGVIGRFLFMSANIMDSKILKSIVLPPEKRFMCDNLYYVLICSKCGLYIDDHISVSQNATVGAITWSDKVLDVHLYLTPWAIISIPERYYSHTVKKQLVSNHYKLQYNCLRFLLRMTSKRNMLFFNSLFSISERFSIYGVGITHILKKICQKYLRINMKQDTLSRYNS
jgi:glycosyltransferase involved in cell wall biosynthesis